MNRKLASRKRFQKLLSCMRDEKNILANLFQPRYDERSNYFAVEKMEENTWGATLSVSKK